MSDKYRVKKSSGKILGPFDRTQIQHLLDSGEIRKSDEFQVYPDGSWEKIDIHFDLDENTLFLKVDKLKDGEDLNKKEETEESFPSEFRHQDKKATSIRKNNPDKTIVLGDDSASKQDKTIINKDTLKYLAEQRAQEKKKQIQSDKTEVIEEEKIDYQNDATQVLSRDELNLAKLEAKDNDWDPNLTKDDKEEGNDDSTQFFQFEKEDLESQKKVNLRKLLITVVAILFIMVIFNPEEVPDENTFKVKYPKLDFPIAKEYEEKAKAEQLLAKGVQELKERHYFAILKASRYFKASSEFKIDNNIALEYLFYTYARLLSESEFPSEDSRTIYKLFKLFESRLVANPLLATATGYFFINIKKDGAAQYMIEKFLKVNKQLRLEGEISFFTPTNPTRELFAVYLGVLDRLGNTKRADSVLNALLKQDGWNLDIYLAVIDYYLNNGELDLAQKYINQGLKEFTSSEDLLLLQAKMLVVREDYQGLKKILSLLKKIERTFSPTNYSKFFHYVGILKLAEKDPDNAIKLFKKSLSIRENKELREQLSAIYNEVDNKNLSILARESRARELISASDEADRDGDYDRAFALLLDAIDIAPEFITPKRKLAELQLKRSLFKEAIASMEDLFNKYPDNKDVIFSLAKVYIEAYRFPEAQNIVSIISRGPFKNDPEYYSIVSSMYLKMNDFLQSASWLRKSMIRNPLNDEDIYKFAELLLKYNKFDQAKKLIVKALELNPIKLEYHLVYAAIIYELEDVETALGYLRDLQKDFPDNTKLLSEIAIYYYRSGQFKGFEYTKEKIEKLDAGGEDLYRFLQRKALYNEEFNDVVKYGLKVLEIKPHDLEMRMLVGKILIEQEKYKIALDLLAYVRNRLEGYPKLQYYLSRLYLKTGNREKAKELAQKEVTENPNSEVGYVLLGDIFLQEENFKEAEKYYKKAQDVDGESVDAIIGMAFITYKRNQHELALDLYKRAIRKRPNDASLHKKLGDVYRYIGQSKLAIESYKTHLKLNENSPYKKQIESYIKLLD